MRADPNVTPRAFLKWQRARSTCWRAIVIFWPLGSRPLFCVATAKMSLARIDSEPRHA